MSTQLQLRPEAARDIAIRVAGRVFTHPCELDPSNGVTKCTHPAHRGDGDRLRELLDAIGLTTPASAPVVKKAPAPRPEPRSVGRPVTQPCGTPAGYIRHRNHGEKPCKACTAANSKATAIWRAADRALMARHHDEFERLVQRVRAANPCKHSGGRERTNWRFRTRYEATLLLRKAHPEEYEGLLEQAWAGEAVAA